MLKNFDRKLELSDGLETQSVKILYYEFDKAIKDNYKSYEYVRLCTILDGEKKVSINGQDSFSYNQDSFILLPSHSTVEMEIANSTKALVLELNDSLVDNINSKVSDELELPMDFDAKDLFLGKNQGSIDYCLGRISSALINTNEKDTKFLLDLYVQELVYFLLKEKGAATILSKPNQHPVSRAVTLMKDNIVPPISLEQIAFEVNMSLSGFSQKFKSIMGLTPKNYYTHLKLLKAKELLKEGTVNEAAWQLGFENVGHFIRLFRLRFHQTPKDYQMSLLNAH